MNYDEIFTTALQTLRDDGNYRVFADLERHAGDFPKATRYREDGSTQEVTVWCSNDYLGMGQNRGRCRDARGDRRVRHRGGRHPQHLRHQPLPRELERELADLHGKEAALIFTSGYVSNWAALGTLASKIPGSSSIPTRSTTPR
jgi:5-aminolevulinate synthase